MAAAYAEFDFLADSLLKGMSPLRDNQNRRARDYRTLKFTSAALLRDNVIKSNGLCYLNQERRTPTPHSDMISACDAEPEIPEGPS